MKWRLFFRFLAVISLAFLAFALFIVLQIPSEKTLKGCLTASMNEVELCPGSKSYASLRQISPYVVKAVVISEDADFWNHQGFDWEELEKSFQENWETGSYKRGGSTITQQLAKNLFLSKRKSLVRKGIEALITWRIEKVLTKKEIIERYLNVVELGPKIYGIKAAAKYYFNKSPGEVDLLESAFLAMLLPSPVKYSVSFRKKELTPFARKRVKRILRDLGRTGRVPMAEANAALARVDWVFKPAPEDDLLFSDEELEAISDEPIRDLEPSPTDAESQPVDPELEKELMMEN